MEIYIISCYSHNMYWRIFENLEIWIYTSKVFHFLKQKARTFCLSFHFTLFFKLKILKTEKRKNNRFIFYKIILLNTEIRRIFSTYLIFRSGKRTCGIFCPFSLYILTIFYSVPYFFIKNLNIALNL